MVDPVSLAAIGGVALSEGIKFLYGQAGAILQRRRERKQATTPEQAPLVVESGELLEHPVEPVMEDAPTVDELAVELANLRKDLSGYVDGVEDPDPNDPETRRVVYALRAALEAAIGQEITFKGEQRVGDAAPLVRGKVTAKTIRGIASGIDTDVLEGQMEGEVHTDTLEREGNAAGVRIRASGSPRPDR